MQQQKRKAPFLITSETGMTGLVNGLSENVNIEYSTPVTEVKTDDDEYVISTPKQEYRSSKIVIASGVNSVTYLFISFLKNAYHNENKQSNNNNQPR